MLRKTPQATALQGLAVREGVMIPRLAVSEKTGRTEQPGPRTCLVTAHPQVIHAASTRLCTVPSHGADEVFEQSVEVLFGDTLALDLLDCVDHRRVVLPAEAAAEFGQRAVRQLLA